MSQVHVEEQHMVVFAWQGTIVFNLMRTIFQDGMQGFDSSNSTVSFPQ